MHFAMNIGPPQFKFQQSPNTAIRVSWTVWLIALCAALAFTFARFGRASRVVTYNSLAHRVSDKVERFIFMLAAPDYTHMFSVVVFRIETDVPDEFFVDADLTILRYRQQSQLTIPIQASARSGTNRLFATGLFSFDAILSQVSVSGNIKNIKGVVVSYVMGDPEFTREMYAIRYVCMCISAVCAFVYIFGNIFYANSRAKMVSILTSICLILSVAANCPIIYHFNSSEMLVVHCFDSLSRGFLSAFTLVALFLFVYDMNGGKSPEFVLLMSMLFILGHSIGFLVTDTRILTSLFDANIDVWMFFMSISVTGKVVLFSLLIYQNILAITVSRKFDKPLVYAYAMCTVLLIASNIGQGLWYFFHSYGHYALDFLGDYLLQTLISLVYADIHWFLSPIRKMSLMEQHIRSARLDFPNIGDETDG